MPEALELVHDHEVGLEGVDAGRCQLRAQIADDPGPVGPVVGGDVLPGPGEALTELEEPALDVALAGGDLLGDPPLQSRLEGARQFRIDAAFLAGPAHPAAEAVSSGEPLQHVQGPSGVRQAPGVLEQPVKECSLLHGAHAGLEVEGRARRQRDEVDLALFEAGYLRRQQGQSGGQRKIIDALQVGAQPLHVLRGDVGVGADVDDVDAVDLVPEVLDRPRDDTPGHERLAEPDLVGYQEPPGGVRVLVEPAEDVVDRAALEVLECGQDRRHVGGRACFLHS